MDLMHTGDIDTFCLVSSDSDFTRLAQRLREAHKTVIGFGERKTPEAFISSCHRFIYFDNLLSPMSNYDSARQKPKDAIELISKAMIEDEDGWATVSPIGQRLPSITPDFDPRNYGCKKLIELIRATEAFEFKEPEGSSKEWRIRFKSRRDDISQ